MLDTYSIPKNELITWALSNNSWKLIRVSHQMEGGADKKKVSRYVWITESGRIVKLETIFHPGFSNKFGSSDDFENTTINDGSTEIFIDIKP